MVMPSRWFVSWQKPVSYTHLESGGLPLFPHAASVPAPALAPVRSHFACGETGLASYRPRLLGLPRKIARGISLRETTLCGCPLRGHGFATPHRYFAVPVAAAPRRGPNGKTPALFGYFLNIKNCLLYTSERFLQPVFLQQLPVQEEAAALAVFFPGNVLRRDGVNAQLCQKQRLRAQISKRIRPDGSLALQNVHDGERGLVVHKISLPHDHVPVGIGGILVRRQPGVYNGISHNGAVALAQHRIGPVSYTHLVVKRIGGQQLEEYFRSKAGELFTRGEVQAMSPREISENYDAIRESMEMWDENGELPEDEQGQPDAPTRPDEQMQPNAPELENAGETVYDEIDESLLAPGYENWTDLNRFMQTVLENPELSVEQRVQYIQQAYERTKDKTDILVPRSAADIKEILENGKFEFDWPDELGFNPGYTCLLYTSASPSV